VGSEIANDLAKKVTSPPPFLENGGGQPQVLLISISLLSVIKFAPIAPKDITGLRVALATKLCNAFWSDLEFDRPVLLHMLCPVVPLAMPKTGYGILFSFVVVRWVVASKGGFSHP